MLIPLLLSAFSASPFVLKQASHSHQKKTIVGRPPVHGKRARRRGARPVTATKGDIQFVMLTAPPQFQRAPEQSQDLPRRLMPLTATLRLDTRVQEEREEEDLIGAINNERIERGMEPLAEDPLLNVTARAHSREMCALCYFDHRSPTPSQRMPMDRYLKALRAWGEIRPDKALVGENIFYASVTDDLYNIGYAHASLMHSPGHRANILEPRFTKVGVGLYRDSEGRFWVTEMFLRDG